MNKSCWDFFNFENNRDGTILWIVNRESIHDSGFARNRESQVFFFKESILFKALIFKKDPLRIFFSYEKIFSNKHFSLNFTTASVAPSSDFSEKTHVQFMFLLWYFINFISVRWRDDLVKLPLGKILTPLAFWSLEIRALAKFLWFAPNIG